MGEKEFIRTPLSLSKYIGRVGSSADGRQIVIFAARSLDDLDVAFEDGMIVWNTSYAAFEGGTIERPKWPSPGPFTSVRVGRMGMSRDGYPMSILAYRTAKDIDVIFEDGTVLRKKRYDQFKNGRISKPRSN